MGIDSAVAAEQPSGPLLQSMLQNKSSTAAKDSPPRSDEPRGEGSGADGAPILSDISTARLEDLAGRLGSDLSFEGALTEKERTLFRRAVSSGSLGPLVGLWVPWWSNAPRSPEELLKNSSAVGPGSLGGLRDEASRVPSFGTVSKKPASPLMRFLVVDLLFSYCRAMRIYNGDTQCDGNGVASLLVAGSPVLLADARHEGMPQVVASCCANVSKSEFDQEMGPLFTL